MEIKMLPFWRDCSGEGGKDGDFQGHICRQK